MHHNFKITIPAVVGAATLATLTACGSSGHPAAAPTVTHTVTVPGPTVTKTKTITAAPAKPKSSVLFSSSGSGNYNSAPFTVSGGQLVVTYSYSGNTMGGGMGGDNFTADIENNGDDMSIANDIAISGGHTTSEYPDLSFGGSHQYHLSIQADSQCQWHFTIVDKG